MKGIDVSKHQGKIDWAKVQAAGVEFAIIRAGFGKYTFQEDTYFRANIAGAKANDIPVGVYWYSYAVTPTEAREEARVCLKVIEKYREQITLPVFFDQEYEKGILALDTPTRTEICRAFMEEIQESGYRAGLYCSWDWYQNKVNRDKLAAWPVWIAQYSAKCRYTGGNLVFWQYSSKGRVDGISGNVDLDEGYDGLFQGKTGWEKRSGLWYWLENGVPVTSKWVKDNGHRYYLGPDGAMLTGVRKIDGKLYYLNEAKREGIPEGACVITDKDGAIITDS